MKQTISVSGARQQWSQLVNKVFQNQARIIVEKSGIPVAAVISAEELTRFTQLEEERKQRFKVIDEIREAFKDVPSKEIEREVAKAVQEVRAEMYSKAA